VGFKIFNMVTRNEYVLRSFFLISSYQARDLNMNSTPPSPASIADALVATDLTFAYHKKSPVVLNIPYLNVKRGERVFLHGPSGSGKTTLLGLIAGILTPNTGRIEVLGQNFTAMGGFERDRFRGAHFGYIFQIFNLIPYLNVRQNIELPLGISPARNKRVGSERHGIVKSLAKDLGIEPLLDKPVTKLSVGQQQRVAAARAMIGSPEIMIADEPTSALDSDHREAFLRTLFLVAEHVNASILFVSHDQSLRPLFSRTIPLREINIAKTDPESLKDV
jgi:putative ABC transport system ATP-binding protein